MRIELTHKGFADLSLTTWVPRPGGSDIVVECQRPEACSSLVTRHADFLERETGFEPATSTLARSHSTTELFPLAGAETTFQHNRS